MRIGIAVLLIAAAPAFASGASGCHAYDYDDQAHWGGECRTGTTQSPVAIDSTTPADLPALVFHYKPLAADVSNTANNIQVTAPKAAAESLDAGGGNAQRLVQFHFHFPSEHTVSGVRYAGELHLVHANPKGGLTVVGVLIESSSTPNPALDSIVQAATGLKACASKPSVKIDVAALLPAQPATGYKKYNGSLTSPKCGHDVTWLVLARTITASASQIEALKKLPSNARDTQPLNGRTIYVQRGR